MARHRHLIVRGLGRASDEFEPVGGGGTRRPRPVADRGEHARQIRSDLQRLSDAVRETAAEQRAAGVPSNRRGVTVTVTSRPGEELVTGESLRANSRGRQILNVRRQADTRNRRGTDRAIYHLSEKAIESLERSLFAYEAWDEPAADDDEAILLNEPDDTSSQRRKPNFWLFESASSFRVAKVEDLWTDPLENFPREKGPVEWEIWVRTPMRRQFEATVAELGIELTGKPTAFVDILVYNGVATKSELARLIQRSAAVVELRGASDFIAEHLDLPPPDRLRQINAIAARVLPAPPNAPWVTLLDSGVNPVSGLLAPSLPRSRCRVVSSAFDAFDTDGHGSKMAGVALYGDLSAIASGDDPIVLETALESITVFDHSSAFRIPARDAISRAVVGAEQAEPHARVYCLAATIVGEAEDGRPTSSSGAVDDLAFNDGIATRLFCVAVGNVDADASTPYQVASYATRNGEHGIQSPAQALNVLSVGALTTRCTAPQPLAMEGDLSPRSRTAQAWDGRRHKPDVVMEGGNHGIDPGGQTSRAHGPDMIATTSNRANSVTLTGDTSAACAAASRLAGRVMARYPALRAETVRALIVHNSQWTDAMRARWSDLVRGGMQPVEATLANLDCYGWGVPDEERTFWSAGNAATLIAEDDLRPYQRGASGITLKEMKSFRLPWPDAALRALRATEIELRCTLSYFVEPDLHSASLGRRQLYPSHGLRFDLQRFSETEARAQSRVNRAVSSSDPSADDNGWTLGWKRRGRGTLHHDVWKGPAYELVGRRLINVTPVRGWWATTKQFEPEDVPVRFSLIVSIRTPETTSDLMIEMRNAVPAGVLVDTPAIVSV